MTLYEKLLANWEAGYCTILKWNVFFKIISTKYADGFRSAGSSCAIEAARAHIGYSHLLESDIKELEKEGWEIVGTIHCTELFGEGLKIGQKVRIKEGGEIVRILGKDFGLYIISADGDTRGFFSAEALEPYYDEPETIEIDGKKYDKAQVEEKLKELNPIE